ncbi:MAG: hypothetical protein QM709_12775 [Spongiibacteraceae bacterium]
MSIVSTELTLLNELAKVTATQREWLSIAEVIQSQIGDDGFLEPYRRMEGELMQCYRFIEKLFEPFLAISKLDQFDSVFVSLSENYQKSYLIDLSKPRHAADRAYEVFLGLLQRKEFKTGYPLLKRTFDRLDYFVDKYVTNDAWLVMSIDSMLRRLSRFLHDIADLRKVDREEAFLVYRSLMISVEHYLELFKWPSSPGRVTSCLNIQKSMA